MKTLAQKHIPKFKNSQEAAAWWDSHDVTDYLHELEPVEVQFDLDKPHEETVVFRLNTQVKKHIESIARKKGLNLSSLLRMWIMEKIPHAQT